MNYKQNLIMLKLVGALTSKPYSFKSRSWELKTFNSIDLLDSMGTNILVDLKGNDIVGIKPLSNDSINEDWITDKVRYSYDGNKSNRLTNIFLKDNVDSLFLTVNLENAYSKINFEINFGLFCEKFGNYKLNIYGQIGDQISSESVFLFKKLLNFLGSNNIVTDNFRKSSLSTDLTLNNSFNLTLKNLDTIDCCVLVNFDPRLELPILNLRLRKNFLKNNLIIASFGFLLNPIYNIYSLGNSSNNLVQFIEGRHKFSMKFINSTNPAVLVGSNILKRIDGSLIFSMLQNLINLLSIKLSYKNINLVNLKSNDSVFNELGVNSSNIELINDESILNIIFMLGSNNLNLLNKQNLNNFVVYLGAYGNNNLMNSDVLIPTKGIYESNGLFINLEGLCQNSLELTSSGLSNINSDVIVLLSFFDYIRKGLNSSNNLNLNSELEQYSRVFSLKDYRNDLKDISLVLFKNSLEVKNYGLIKKSIFENSVINYYITDLITANSKIMGQCESNLSSKISVKYINK